MERRPYDPELIAIWSDGHDGKNAWSGRDLLKEYGSLRDGVRCTVTNSKKFGGVGSQRRSTGGGLLISGIVWRVKYWPIKKIDSPELGQRTGGRRDANARKEAHARRPPRYALSFDSGPKMFHRDRE